MTITTKTFLGLSKPSKDGERILKILQNEYQMSREFALKLMRDGGTLLATALLMRKPK